MNWISKVNEIKENLLSNQLTSSHDELVDVQMTLGTPGEMYLEAMNVLLNWKKINEREYFLNESQIEELLQYGQSINYFNIVLMR